MPGLSDNFSSRLFRAVYERPSIAEPPIYAATNDDVAALAAVREASARFLDALRRNPWTFDSTETVSWADHVAEHAAIDSAIAAALDQARRSLEAGL